jgi:hypothetical protein
LTKSSTTGKRARVVFNGVGTRIIGDETGTISDAVPLRDTVGASPVSVAHTVTSGHYPADAVDVPTGVALTDPKITFTAGTLGMKVEVPATATAPGRPGQFAVDATHIYTYTGDGTTHTWVRATAATW